MTPTRREIVRAATRGDLYEIVTVSLTVRADSPSAAGLRLQLALDAVESADITVNEITVREEVAQ